MMKREGPSRDRRRPHEELESPAREMVEHLLGEPVPEQAMQRAVEAYVGIGARRTGRRLVRFWWFAGAAAAAAVVLCAIIAWQIHDGEEPPTPPTVDVAISPLDRDAPRNEPLTLQRCRLALRESPEGLFAFLDRQASELLPPTGETFRGKSDAWQDRL